MTQTPEDQIVKYVLERHLTCPHLGHHDCNRCLARWIRAGYRAAKRKEKP